MSIETHPEAAGLADYVLEHFGEDDQHLGKCILLADLDAYLSARLTDDDVVAAAATAISTLNVPGALPDNCPDGEAYRLFARAALTAAAAVIGGER